MLFYYVKNILNIYSQKYTKINNDSDDNLPLEKTATIHNVVILIMFVFNEKHNHYYYKMLLEKLI